MVKINNLNYEIIEDYRKAFDIDILKDRMTNYFNDFDYVLGDWAYGKLRLKGFYTSNSKLPKNEDDYIKIKEYIKEYCAYGCKYFIIKKC